MGLCRRLPNKHKLAANIGSFDFEILIEECHVREGAALDTAPPFERQRLRRISGESQQCIIQRHAGPLDEISQCSILRKSASSQPAFGVAADATSNLNRTIAESVFPVRHSGGAGGVRCEDDAGGSLGSREDANDFRIYMDAVSNDFGKDSIVGEHRTHDSRIAMRELTHRVERVHRVMCSRICCSNGFGKRRVGVAHAKENAGVLGKAAMAAAPSSSGAIVTSLTNPPER